MDSPLKGYESADSEQEEAPGKAGMGTEISTRQLSPLIRSVPQLTVSAASFVVNPDSTRR